MYEPLRFDPHVKPTVWGGRRLGDLLGKRLPLTVPCGETWEISDHPSHRSIVATGPLAGRPLDRLLHDDPHALLGRPHIGPFPWLVKFLDASGWLSVQVHPDERAVVDLWPGEGPKTEAWVVLDAVPGSRIWAGLLPGVDEAGLRKALARGRVLECLHSFEPRRGDCIYLPAGTVHAVGGGVLLAEVQQTSDATFRLYDWDRPGSDGRPRPLHIEQGLACIDYGSGPVRPVRIEDRSGLQPLVSAPCFRLDCLRLTEAAPLGGDGRMHVLVVLAGAGVLETSGKQDSLRPGDVLLLPAGARRSWCRPHGTLELLLTTPPLPEPASLEDDRSCTSMPARSTA